jgi:hypothetical protein
MGVGKMMGGGFEFLNTIFFVKKKDFAVKQQITGILFYR